MPTTTGFATEFITFSRGSLATVTDSNGYIKWAPHNLLLASEQFDASAWAKSDVTISANLIAAPNGTTTADKIVEAATTAHHFINQNDKLSDYTVPHTFGVYAKVGERQYLNLSFQWTTDYIAATFDLSSGTVTSTRAGGSGSGQTATITSVGGGWYLCTLNGIYGAAGSNATVITISNTGTPTGPYGNAYLGVSGNGLYTWGAHLYRSDLGGMQANASAYPYYNPSTPKNLLGYSEDFSVGSWSKSNTTVSSNATSAPNGSLSADLLYPATTGTARQAVQSASGVASTPYTNSVYVKSAGFQWVALTSPSGNSFGVYFDIINGVKGAEVSGCVGSIAPMGNGWFRCSVTQTVAGTTIYTGAALVDGDSNTTATASGTSGIYLWGAQLSDSASLDPYVGSYGAAPSPAAAYGPRLDYDPSTLAAKGLLVEEQRTNLTTASETFTTGWTSLNATISNNVAISPAGTNTASKLVTANSTTFQGRYVLASYTNGTTYTVSAYVKAAEITRFSFQSANLGQAPTATFNLSTGTVVSTGVGSTATMTAVGNGWYRVTATRTSTATGVEYLVIYCINSADSNNFAGNGSDGIFVWGYQLEAGAFATSYIPTAAATVTRNADVASVATSQFPYSATEGTVVFNGDFVGVGSVVPGLFTLSDGTPANFPTASWVAGWTSASVTSLGRRASNVSATTITSSQTLTANIPFKAGAAFAVNGTDALTVNGGTVETQAGVTSAYTNDILRLGTFVAGGNPGNLNGHIRQITYIPRRLTNAELISRST